MYVLALSSQQLHVQAAKCSCSVMDRLKRSEDNIFTLDIHVIWMTKDSSTIVALCVMVVGYAQRSPKGHPPPHATCVLILRLDIK